MANPDGSRSPLPSSAGPVFPALIGALAAVVFSKYRWVFIVLDSTLAHPLTWTDLLPAAAGAAVGLAFYAAGRWYRRRLTASDEGLRHSLLAALCAVLLVGSFNYLASLPAAESALWLAVRSRLGGHHSDFVAMELSTLRLDVLSDRDASQRPVVIVTGSSQVLHGIDCNELRVLHPDLKIKRRALAGMTPLRMVMALDQLSLEPGAWVTMYVSESDMVDASLFTDWHRPIMTVSGWRKGRACYPPHVLRRDWAHWLDLWLGSRLHLWRLRDYIQYVGLHPVAPAAADSHPEQALLIGNAGVDAYASVNAFREAWTVHRTAMRYIVDQIHANGARLVVFEGQSRPDVYTASRLEARRLVRDDLTRWADEDQWFYVTAEEQDLQFSADDWIDHAHLGVSGRAKLTAAVSDWIARNVEDQSSFAR